MRPTDTDAITKVAVVVLTMGNRPQELTAAVESALAQTRVDIELIVVANGVLVRSLGLPDDDRVKVVGLEQNAGIPGGRNVGVEHASAPIVAFLDDDARFLTDNVLAASAETFRQRARIGAIALRIVDEHGRTARRHVPRIGARHPDRAGPVTAFLGSAVVMRTAAFRESGGFPAAFMYAMEETDLAFRLIDRGWEIHYDGTPAVFHPATEPGRHPGAAGRTMRNRVWLAHRSLPAPIAALYVANWVAISTLRRPRQVRSVLRAAVNGWRTRPGPRSPIRWRTVARLSRFGRPPII